jgi:hypothetical protein
MAGLNRIYTRTEQGARALEAQEASVRGGRRWVLALITSDTHLDGIRGTLHRYSEDEIGSLLAELEALGYIRSADGTSEHDLDFTGALSLAALRQAHNAAAG